MKCPRCETSVLDEREREGVTVDVCRECRGLWLDRSELERIIARAVREQSEYEPPVQRRDDTPPRGVRRDDDDYAYTRDGRRHKKRHWFDSLSDIFD
jgi:Zn-finger nucleic acid-binding protein